MRPRSTTRQMGTVLHTWPNGRFVQIQDGFRSKETLINDPTITRETSDPQIRRAF